MSKVGGTQVEQLQSCVRNIRKHEVVSQLCATTKSKIRGCGMPEDFITYLPSLIGTMQPIQYQSCFISDSSQNETDAVEVRQVLA